MFMLEIDGTDITPYIAYGGVQWQRSDVDGPDAGRDLSGTLRRNRVATKHRLDITCRPLTTEEAKIVLDLIMPETVEVRYSDIQEGVVRRVMYSNNIPATFMMKRRNGTELWGGITFPLIEV